MGFYDEQVVPRLIDKGLGGKGFGRLRARAIRGVTGEVVEIGFGSGTNLPHYPTGVTKVWAVDPSAVGRQLAARRVAASPIPVEFVGLDGQDLPLADESVDCAVSTWTLCSIPDAGRAIAELRRVLRPGGTMHFLEHGHAPDPSVAKWQERLNPLQQKICGGCNLDRRIDSLISGAGFELTKLANFYIKGPKTFCYMYAGVATKS